MTECGEGQGRGTAEGVSNRAAMHERLLTFNTL